MEIEEIRQELLQLFRSQMETLDLATFVGMTDEGWREYDERQARIHVLGEQITLEACSIEVEKRISIPLTIIPVVLGMFWLPALIGQ